jgi:hypothetical protein
VRGSTLVLQRHMCLLWSFLFGVERALHMSAFTSEKDVLQFLF